MSPCLTRTLSLYDAVMRSPEFRLVVKTVCATLAILALVGALGAYAFMRSGFYNIAATSQHLQFVYTFLEQGMHHSVRFHARDISAPALTDEAMIARGAVLYRDHCVQCHGAPGVAPAGIGMGMQPVPGPLIDARSKWQPNQMYWIVRHGIKMSGMPAWEYRMSDEQLWQVVAFMQRLPELTPAQYAAAVKESGTDEKSGQP